MQKLLCAVLVVLSITGMAAASPQSDVMAVVNQFVEGFNKGDVMSTVATCADQTVIIDEFAPHVWQGAGACSSWASDYAVDIKKNGVTDGVVRLLKPLHVDIAGDVAYVVVPADYAYKKDGKPIKETGSLFTVVLKKGSAGWRITGWAWSQA